MPAGPFGATLDAGVDVWKHLLNSLTERGLTADHGSSALATAVAGALAYEGITPEQFLIILNQTVKLWRMEDQADGPTLIFDCGPLSAQKPLIDLETN